MSVGLRSLTIVSLLSLFLALSAAGSSGTVYVEDWSGNILERFEGRGDAGPGFNPRCFVSEPGLLTMDCQSSALLSYMSWDPSQRIEFTGTIYAEPGADSTKPDNVTHFTMLASDSDHGSRYGALDIGRFGGWDLVWLSGAAGPQLTAIVPHKRHQAKIVWDGAYNFYLDGRYVGRNTQGLPLPGERMRFWAGCTSVGENTPDDGSYAHCEFGSLTVITPATPTPTSTPAPSTTPKPRRWFMWLR